MKKIKKQNVPNGDLDRSFVETFSWGEKVQNQNCRQAPPNGFVRLAGFDRRVNVLTVIYTCPKRRRVDREGVLQPRLDTRWTAVVVLSLTSSARCFALLTTDPNTTHYPKAVATVGYVLRTGQNAQRRRRRRRHIVDVMTMKITGKHRRYATFVTTVRSMVTTRRENGLPNWINRDNVIVYHTLSILERARIQCGHYTAVAVHSSVD